MAQPIRCTTAVHRRYALLMWTAAAAAVACAVAFPVVLADRVTAVASVVASVVAGGLVIGLLFADRASSAFSLSGTVLRSAGLFGRRVDLARVATARIVEHHVKLFGPRSRWSTLELTDAEGGRARLMYDTKRLGPLYEPADLHLIAEPLAASGDPNTQDVARRLRSFADQGHPVIDRSL